MNTPRKTLLIVIGLLTALESTALAQEIIPVFAGNLCNPTTNADAGRITYNQYGAANASTTATANVTCGSVIPKAGAFSLHQVVAAVYDRNGFQNVCCTFLALDGWGTAVASASRCSSGNQRVDSAQDHALRRARGTQVSERTQGHVAPLLQRVQPDGLCSA
jgi:hypothetical protein